MTRSHDEQSPDNALLVELLDEKLKSFATKDEMSELVDKKVDGLVKKARAPLVWFMAGITAVLGLFAIDLSSFDAFARKAFANAFGIHQTIDDRASQVIDNYFQDIDFLAGTYASSSEVTLEGCGEIVLSLPFQSDTDQHAASAYLSIVFPDSNQTYVVTSNVNSKTVEQRLSTPEDRRRAQNADFAFDLTQVMRDVPATMRSSGFMHEYWIRIKALPAGNAPTSGAENGVRDLLRGLPTERTPWACANISDVIVIRMMVQVAGDPRIRKPS
ncbi:hypothetical protein [Aliiroseovarius sp. 2305UL8-7]|uniref:hypothetical protein n=1 Tax=Aliiroseovarius conchicola TaxID=3121637 RepID=UPI003527F610